MLPVPIVIPPKKESPPDDGQMTYFIIPNLTLICKRNFK